MRVERRRACGLISALLCAVLGCVACANVLGVANDPMDAVTAICACPDVSRAALDCEQTLENRLELATSDVRAAWLSNYSAADCTLCKNAPQCFYKAPTCVASGNACNTQFECCSWSLSNPLPCDMLHGSLCK